MTLYHGSNVDIQKIELSKCSPNKDFEKGILSYDHKRTG